MDGDGPIPFEHFLGRLCQEFSCVPSVAYREWLHAPDGMLERILDYRTYVWAKDLWDHAKSKKDLPDHPMVAMVETIDFELAQEAMDDRAPEH